MPRPIDFRALRRMIQPIQALRLHGWLPTDRAAGQDRGPCPIHGSSGTGSRILAVCATVAYCHRCQWTGDAVAIHAHYLHLPVYRAALDLCSRLGVPVPYL